MMSEFEFGTRSGAGMFSGDLFWEDVPMFDVPANMFPYPGDMEPTITPSASVCGADSDTCSCGSACHSLEPSLEGASSEESLASSGGLSTAFAGAGYVVRNTFIDVESPTAASRRSHSLPRGLRLKHAAAAAPGSGGARGAASAEGRGEEAERARARAAVALA